MAEPGDLTHSKSDATQSALRATARARLKTGVQKNWIVLAVLYGALMIGGVLIAQQWKTLTGFSVADLDDDMIFQMIIIALAVFIVISALPFVPGAEIGLGLMMLFGAPLAPAVYLSMICALLIAFLAGNMVPARWISRFFGALGLARAQRLSQRLEESTSQERLAILCDQAPSRLLPFALKNRYATLAILLNVPGNSILGGGGGIALAAGMSGLFSWPAFAAMLVIAVAPVPILFFLMGH